MSKSTDANLAYCMLRATLGLNICFHGVSRILRVGCLREFPSGYVSEDAASRMVRAPLWPLASLDRDDPGNSCAGWHASAFCSGSRLTSDVRPYLRIALRQDWDIAALQLIYAAVYAALLPFREQDWFSLDSLILHRSSAPTPSADFHIQRE